MRVNWTFQQVSDPWGCGGFWCSYFRVCLAAGICQGEKERDDRGGWDGRTRTTDKEEHGRAWTRSDGSELVLHDPGSFHGFLPLPSFHYGKTMAKAPEGPRHQENQPQRSQAKYLKNHLIRPPTSSFVSLQKDNKEGKDGGGLIAPEYPENLENHPVKRTPQLTHLQHSTKNRHFN